MSVNSEGVPLYHLALESEWDPRAGEYTGSTIERGLAEEGFVHCSTAEQVQATADRFYAGRTDVVLLTIDRRRLDAEVRVEGGFPHIYGPVPTAAVVAAVPVPLGPDGRLNIEAVLDLLC